MVKSPRIELAEADLQEVIHNTLKAMNDEQIYFLYWLHYGGPRGSLEGSISLEYFNRGLNKRA